MDQCRFHNDHTAVVQAELVCFVRIADGPDGMDILIPISMSSCWQYLNQYETLRRNSRAAMVSLN